MEMFQNTKIDFLSKRKYAYIFSGIVIFLGIISLIAKGGPKLGIDFTGGTLIQLNFAQNQDIKNTELRNGLSELGFKNVDIQRFTGSNSLIFKLKESDQVSEEKINKLKDILKKDFVIEKTEVVGPAVGDWLLKRAILAFILAFLGIIIYVGIRFKAGVWGYAGVIALAHDVMVVISVFSIFNKEITLTVVAALMTIAGYSINDTIVIYDRIRENLRIRYKEGLSAVINDSINQTLSRTVITSLTTLISVVFLLLFGGQVLFDFSLALFIGIISGIYSTIFIAVPIVLDLKHKKNAAKK